MSKTIVRFAAQKKSYPVADGIVATGWMPGQCMTLESDGLSVKLANTDNTMFVAIDDDLELSSPPTGSLVTVAFGAGTEIIVDHSQEVANADSSRVYASEVESASAGANLYVGPTGKWQTTTTGSVKAKLSEIPNSNSNYKLGLILRF